MRPVNLLPASHRPQRASGALSGSAYVVVGVLVALLLAMSAYVLTANKVADAKQKTAEAKRETDAATAKTEALGGFTSFVAIKQARVQSVRQIADARFDWERLMRELALVLPDDVWLTSLDASVGGSGSADAPEAESTGPGADLSGCARRHPDVAAVMVRLRSMDSVAAVSLQESARGGGEDGGEGGACAGTSFTMRIEFGADATAPATGIERVPASLGGGK